METAAERRLRREAWFERGADAFERICRVKPPHGYVCPLCVLMFTREQLDAGYVTDEHVPPEAVGGNALILTCRNCNGWSSGLLDKHMATGEKFRTWGQPHALGALPVTFSHEGIPNHGSISFDGSTYVMVSHPKQNNPSTLAAYNESMEHFGEGSQVKLRVAVDHEPRRDQIGWMRSAYLAAFAMYGYRYSLHPSFDPLRDAIGDPDGCAFTPVIFGEADPGPLNCRIVEVVAPAELAGCKLVIFGPRHILLPPPAAPLDWFDTLPTHLPRLLGSDLSVRSLIGLSFPGEPMHLIDS